MMTALAVTYASSQAALPPTQPPLALIPQIWWNIPSLTSVPLTYPHLHSPLTTYLNTSPPQQDVLTTSHTHLLPFPTQHLFPQQPTGSSPHVHTPVNTHLLACLLTGHPNSGFTTYLLQGLTQGSGLDTMATMALDQHQTFTQPWHAPRSLIPTLQLNARLVTLRDPFLSLPSQTSWSTLWVPFQRKGQGNGASLLCAALGVPLVDDKKEGPTTCFEYLGILLNSAALEACHHC